MKNFSYRYDVTLPHIPGALDHFSMRAREGQVNCPGYQVRIVAVVLCSKKN